MVLVLADAVLVERHQQVNVEHLHVILDELRQHLDLPLDVRVVRQLSAVDHGDVLRFDAEDAARVPQLILTHMSLLLEVACKRITKFKLDLARRITSLTSRHAQHEDSTIFSSF